MIKKIPFQIESLKDIKAKELFYRGNLELLNRFKVAIVGTRRPINYTKNLTTQLSKKLSNAGVVVVSGSAMGVDIIAQNSAYPNTISVMPCSLEDEQIYPKINQESIKKIYQNSLAISEYSDSFTARNYSFVQRNRIVVALSDILIVSQADLGSGSLTSVEVAKKLKKDIYVLPHRANESEGTNQLLKNGQAKAIFDIDEFVEKVAKNSRTINDEVLEFCMSNPTYEEAFKRFGDLLFEYELENKISIENSFVYVN
jgi:DNA processing protein